MKKEAAQDNLSMLRAAEVAQWAGSQSLGFQRETSLGIKLTKVSQGRAFAKRLLGKRYIFWEKLL